MTRLGTFACVAAALVIGAHVGSGCYSVHIICGSALELLVADGECTMTLVREDMYGSATKFMSPYVRLWKSPSFHIGWWGKDLMYDQKSIILMFPVWFLLVPMALLTAVCTLYRRRPRTHTGAVLCRVCGYDLRGNVSGRCPECGCATENLGKEECEVGP